MAKRALLVGVNDYRSANDLQGCVNDVLDMHFTLRSLFGFKTEDDFHIILKNPSAVFTSDLSGQLFEQTRGRFPGACNMQGHRMIIESLTGHISCRQADQVGTVAMLNDMCHLQIR